MVRNVHYEKFVDSMPSLAGKDCGDYRHDVRGTGYCWCAIAAVKKGAAAVLLLNRPSARATACEADVTAAAKESGSVVYSVDCDLMSFRIGTC